MIKKKSCTGIIGAVIFCTKSIIFRSHIHGRTSHTEIWGPFHERFSIVVQIRCKIHSPLIEVVVKWSLWNFAHDTTAVLLWDEQKVIAIWYPTMKLHWNQFYIYIGRLGNSTLYLYRMHQICNSDIVYIYSIVKFTRYWVVQNDFVLVTTASFYIGLPKLGYHRTCSCPRPIY